MIGMHCEGWRRETFLFPCTVFRIYISLLFLHFLDVSVHGQAFVDDDAASQDEDDIFSGLDGDVVGVA